MNSLSLPVANLETPVDGKSFEDFQIYAVSAGETTRTADPGAHCLPTPAVQIVSCDDRFEGPAGPLESGRTIARISTEN